MATDAGKTETISRFVDEPAAGVLALAMEYTATALNSAQGLIAGRRLLPLLRSTEAAEPVLALFSETVAELPWAVYEVRRTLSPRADGKAGFARSLRIFDVGDRAAMLVRLEQRARVGGLPVVRGDAAFPDDTHPRVWVRRRDRALLDQGLATAEQFLTAAPATAVNKIGPAFGKAWARASQYALIS